MAAYIVYPTPPNGVSVSSADINEEGHLILTMSDGSTFDAGEVAGTARHVTAGEIRDGDLIVVFSDGSEHNCGALPVGASGPPGQDGEDGDPGKSAYQIAVEGGFSGTVERWVMSLRGVPGEEGADGSSARVSIGTVTTLSPGSLASVTNVGTANDAVLDIGIPRGDSGSPGSPGASASVAVGTVTGLAAGASPTVSNAGTSSAAVLNFGIPAGAAGPTGPSGVSKFNVTVAITPGLIALGTVTYNVTAAGILSTDDITVQPTSALPGGLILAHWRVTGNNAVAITLGTPLALGLNLGTPYNFKITAIR